MRTKWLLGAAAAAMALALGAGLPLETSGQSGAAALRQIFLAEACGPNDMLARRDALGALLAGAGAYAQTLPGDPNAPPPLMSGLGDAHLAVSTANAEAQAFFDQGLRFLHAFNHAEAVRAFRQAQRLDPACAMCFWGEAFALGPNINAPMEEAAFAPAFAAARAANEKKGSATPLEQALIEAIQTRYADPVPADRAALDGAFADAMSALAARYPESDIAQIFAAEAIMDTQPWDYWQADKRTPKGRAGEAISRVETVLARSPNNAGAIHLYIHLVEASTDPWRSEKAAERLAAAAPNAGHLVHMPGHIYYRVGRFRDSIRANIDAVARDEAYIRTASPSPIYRYGYYPHNVHFVLTSAAMGGDGRTALDYAARLDEAVPMEMAALVPLAQPVKAAPWFARAQFDAPEAVLAAPEPEAGVAYVNGAWRYARGAANIRLGRPDAARAEAEAIAQVIANGDFAAMKAQNIPGQDALGIYRRVLLGRAFMVERNYDAAIAELRAAVEGQVAIAYTEPPYIYYPVRRTLGAAYLLNGQAALAEMEFLQTLIESPDDAYAYWGLAEARRAKGDWRGASAARTLFMSAFIGPRRQVDAMSL